MNRCKNCKWLNSEKTQFGFECKHPERPFKPNEHRFAKYKLDSQPACAKHFVLKEN